MRKLILALLGILVVVGAIFFGNKLVESNKKPKPVLKKQKQTVYVEQVTNKAIPVVLTANGNIKAKQKIDLYSEVQGVLNLSNKSFKEGTRYAKGNVLLSIKSDEFYATLQSQKSNLFNLITAIMPDVKLDYPNEFLKWSTYLKTFNLAKPVPKLPAFSSDKEKYFVSGRGILTAYYSVKNLEVRHAKHIIKAPFTGVLTEALVTPGSLVRVGQKLGEFIDPSVYELEVSINAAYAHLLQIGNTVKLTNLEKTETYSGKVIRVNGKVDQVSQTIKAYIQVAHKNLKEGLFLEANLVAKTIDNAIEVLRKLVVDNTAIYILENDSILTLKPITPVYFGANTVIVKGLQNSDKILSQPLPGAFSGMVVNTRTKN